MTVPKEIHLTVNGQPLVVRINVRKKAANAARSAAAKAQPRVPGTTVFAEEAGVSQYPPRPPDWPRNLNDPNDALAEYVDEPMLDIINVDSQGNAFDIHDNPIPRVPATATPGLRSKKKTRKKKGPT